MLNRKEFISEVIENVRNSISVSDVVSEDVVLKRSGGSHKGLCPFHNDSKVGSFVVTDGKKLFKCFSCGAGGDVIKYVSMRDGISYVDSALNLALSYGIITREQFEDATSRKFSKREVFEIEKFYIEKDKNEFKNNIATDEVLDKVYRLFIKGFSYLGKNKLSEEHKAVLMSDERQLTELEIEKNLYFTFPTRHILKYFLKDLENNGMNEEVLQTIPGFFYDKSKDSWSFMMVKGLGIPMVNEKGLITGIQIRKDVVTEGKMRYIWFSSSFAMTKENYEYGVASGSPLNVIYPEVLKSKTLFITEGHFKALRLAKEFGCISISVQGVCSWGKIKEALENMKKDHEIKNIMVAYDGDIAINGGVFQQAINMGVSLRGINHFIDVEKIKEAFEDETVKKEYNVYYALWDFDFGKGIDDLILSGNAHKLDKIKLEDLFTLYKQYIAVLRESYLGIYKDINEIPKSERKEIFERIILSTLPKYQNI